jgi:S-ribosylhomocysteine lyase LuxS involved in autoinducer biosynthesis
MKKSAMKTNICMDMSREILPYKSMGRQEKKGYYFDYLEQKKRKKVIDYLETKQKNVINIKSSNSII